MRSELLAELDSLISEGRNPHTAEIDTLSTDDLLACINDEDAKVAVAVSKVLPEIGRAVDAITTAFQAGGRLIYIGAGTSGRLGVLDASECPPTFGVPGDMVIGLIAGGEAALRHAMEGAEDDRGAAVEALNGIALDAKDVVVGLAVSGRTPYVMAGLDHARRHGATSIALTCNPDSPLAQQADVSIAPVVGPEVLTGSTRLKSGTAQKMVLNMLSTASMVKIGKTYGNLMVDLHASNEKLLARAIRVVMQATDCDEGAARAALGRADQQVKPAILMLLTNEGIDAARSRLDAANGALRRALDRFLTEQETINHQTMGR